MNRKYFYYLDAVAEERNFSKAAKKLNISQPSLSQAVQKMEEEYGCRIFDRSTTPLKVTTAGRVILNTGRQVCDIMTQMEKEIADLNEQENRTLTVGASPFRSNYIMPNVIKAFGKKYPGIQVILEELIAGELQDVAKEGTLDLAITTLPVDEQIFEYQEMMPEEIVLAIPKRHPINKQLIEEEKLEYDEQRLFPIVSLDNLSGLKYIFLGEHQSISRYFHNLCETAGFTPQKTVVCRNIETAHSMVEAGVGATVVPYSLLKYADYNRNKVCYYSIKQSEFQREMVVIYRKGQYLSDAAREMLRLLTHYN